MVFSDNDSNKNQIDILTGENGSGKTELLACLALEFARGNTPRISVRTKGDAQKVIAQTLSPFSRFPSEAPIEENLQEVFFEEKRDERQYACVGFSARSRKSGVSTSRAIIEQFLSTLATSGAQLEIAIDVLRFLGYRPWIGIRYSSKRVLRLINSRNTEDDLQEWLEERSASGKLSPVLERELQKSSSERLARLIYEAIEASGIRYSRSLDSFEIAFDYGVTSTSFSALQALVFLRRLGFLSLMECALSDQRGSRIELEKASSGEQNILCLMLGLATHLKSGSLVLIDEPELSLHPFWQQRYLDLLEKTIWSVGGCHVLIATHSPLLVQAALSKGHGVHLLGHSKDVRREASQLEVGSLNAASVETTLMEVFEVPVSNGLALPNELFELVEGPATTVATDAALARLGELRELYRGSRGRELSLIESARELIRQQMDDANQVLLP